ncbi:DUF3618 domain-containing protein [Streptomyces sp. NPDC086080]|uniref:DUF3618 domain-containing protein n=1 Tax=Streptomyces sp. NPDC086080 TaxID=3365748 RepID=UPI0037CCD2FC
MTHDVRHAGSHVDAAAEAAATGRGVKGPDELRRQIEQTRHELGDTVEELAGKMDVKGRARARVEDLRDRAGAMTVQMRSSAAQAGEAGKRNRKPVIVAGAVVATAVGAVMVRRHGPAAGHEVGWRISSSVRGRMPAARRGVGWRLPSSVRGRLPVAGHEVGWRIPSSVRGRVPAARRGAGWRIPSWVRSRVPAARRSARWGCS